MKSYERGKVERREQKKEGGSCLQIAEGTRGRGGKVAISSIREVVDMAEGKKE